MKKNFLMLGMIFASLFGFTSCEFELEQTVGYEVSGLWYGDLDMWINGTRCNYSEIEFMPIGWGYSKGRGVEIDHLWSYRVTHHFEYELIGGSIHLYFDDPELDCVIRDYRISDYYFTGYMDGLYESTKFRLQNDEHFWNDYYGYNGYYYSKEDKGMNDVWNDSIDNDTTNFTRSTSMELSSDSLICKRGINQKSE